MLKYATRSYDGAYMYESHVYGECHAFIRRKKNLYQQFAMNGR